MNTDRMRRNLFRRWRGLPQTRRFTAAEVEQNNRAVELWHTDLKADPGPAPLQDWVGRVRRHNEGPTSIDVQECPVDGSVTVTVRRPKPPPGFHPTTVGLM